MQRLFIEKLNEWRLSENRKPLILQGARQVGKTWILQEFGRLYFENTLYVRMEDNAAMEQLFAGSLEPRRLLQGLAAQTAQPVRPQTTLIILDEIQAVPRALTALKYFQEEAPEYAICVAGSLLGIALNQGISYPVGKVTCMQLHPLSFREFLLACGEEQLKQLVDAGDFEMMAVFRERLEDLLRQYYFVGGMPEAVLAHTQGAGYAAVRQVQDDIIATYQNDFAKHAGAACGERCRAIFTSLPRHLAKENKKFVYGVVKKGARGRDLDDALQFLVDAGLVVQVKRVTLPHLPLAAFADEGAFKLFCVDVGLLGALAGLDSRSIIEGNVLFTTFKGAMAEQYVCQQLVSELGLRPFYWSAAKGGAEVDFLVQAAGLVVPIEVKAEENLRSKSLATFCKSFEMTNALRLSLASRREESWLTNVPLYGIYAAFPSEG